MLELAGILRGHGCTVTLIDTAEPGVLPDGWDVAGVELDRGMPDDVLAAYAAAGRPGALRPAMLAVWNSALTRAATSAGTRSARNGGISTRRAWRPEIPCPTA